MAFGGLVNVIGERLIPVLTPMVKAMTEFIADNKGEIVKDIADSFKFMAGAIRLTITAVRGLIAAFRAVGEVGSAVSGFLFGTGDDEAPARRIAGRGRAAAPAPSLAAPEAPEGGGGRRGGGRRGPAGRAAVSVDFRNMPRGMRVESQADDDTDLEVMTGYALQGAN